MPGFLGCQGGLRVVMWNAVGDPGVWALGEPQLLEVIRVPRRQYPHLHRLLWSQPGKGFSGEGDRRNYGIVDKGLICRRVYAQQFFQHRLIVLAVLRGGSADLQRSVGEMVRPAHEETAADLAAGWVIHLFQESPALVLGIVVDVFAG